MSNVRTYSISQIRRMKGKTDWARIDRMTDAEIEAQRAGDPDWQGFENVDWSKAEVVVPANKVPISIRLDPDVLAFFKGEGSGYQRRINAVLRAYMREVRKRPASATAASAKATAAGKPAMKGQPAAKSKPASKSAKPRR